ncbi:DegT/DnrJ/EryC1/StrS family aminotransferase [Streptomyces sp. NA02950]|uniref:DegT/DnrJ/EryC1/StrS aminotransferase family protein n=1 Tax=Streptomyces sp. NA02950 TaxID=2742137 RepID=UPI0015915581|nr:DegT/DnrJ/EryC1/StrS family aminotransferase [Streptomyces sp. NA02950]QKV97128.1 DegT/DnrJ/EryC1/StrS family aminotransferase [Streptomyces sp. NA02950]
MINVFQPSLGEEELAAVREVFESGWLGRGRRTSAFEVEFASHIGVGRQHVTAVNSCTEGLFMAMELLDINPGDEVVMPSVSFVGAANAVASRGADLVFCDVDERTLNPRPEHVAEALTDRTRAVVVLHYGGRPGWIGDIAIWCRERGIPLVEDAACAVASSVDGVACGTFGDIGVWSFDAMKILVTGDGGMLYARDPDLAARAATMANLGLLQSSGLAAASAGVADRWWEFEVSSFSRRSVTNDLASAIGSVQLRRLPTFVRRRRAIAAAYRLGLADLGMLRLPPELPEGHLSSEYLFWVQLEPRRRNELARHLRQRGIYTTFRYFPLHRVSAYGPHHSPAGAARAAATTLLLPLHQALDDATVQQIIYEVRAVAS